MRRSWFVAFALAFAVAACGSDDISRPFSDFSHASATPACAPTDGPAVAIHLTPNDEARGTTRQRYVQVIIMRRVGEIAGRTWRVDDRGDSAIGGLVIGPSSAMIPAVGQVAIFRADTSKTIDGAVDLLFANGVHVEGVFSAEWEPRAFFCG
jgi:hypothetical protein